ncbi:H-NS family nucleoid-associated regulatory protein [Aliivibrio salmonicida]|uniref:H-NS family histone-like protein n=1 Tax=Aliivibrio salmonicida TaxID=40269 RepID=UPI003D0F24CA
MNPFLKTLLSPRSLRAALRDATPEQLDDGLSTFMMVSEEMKEAHEKKQQEEAEELQKLEQFKQHIIEQGIDFSALSKLMIGKPKAKKKTATAQTELVYNYEKDGEKKQWNGKGDMPNIIKQAIHNGGKLTDFLAR